jgi:hypothetical protein
VPFSDSHQRLPASPNTAWDWFHINAVHIDKDGNLLIDSRHTWTFYKVNRTTGDVIWQLGGRHSSFSEIAGPGQVLDSAGEIFAWQHDPEALGGDRYSIFDNESSGTPLLPASRAVTIQLDEANRTATLLSSDSQPEGLAASSQGDAQTTANGDLLVGWGNLNHFSEFDPQGNLVLNAAFPAGVNSYRAYRLPWRAATTTTASAAGGTYAATVTPAGGNLTPTGTVTFTSGGTTLCTATLDATGAGTCTGAPASGVTATYGGDENFESSAAAPATTTVGGTVPATLSLTLGDSATFGTFAPGVTNDYTATTTADVVSTAGDAALTVSDPSTTAPGHLTNSASCADDETQPAAGAGACGSKGGYSLPGPLLAGGSPLPATVKTWSAPVSHDVAPVAFNQHIDAGDALRTGTYAKTLTFTLATSTP